ncbi:transcriptional regulator with XRE-family HTH domain [Variovorax paradoxus]|uniref:hypothetical protein n=1 Tax=Variovorax paradoxus TaxID=34073 RepID=UPI00278E3A4B|nr:hypothetical protein [Variovorax paradoxus]MDQ0571528.1 transcriptional regulator with XRE-family HTH domain [Variovorax paradoxus]
MTNLTRQELCVRLKISESTVRRLEAKGMPTITSEWMKAKRYNLVEVMKWLRPADPDRAAAAAIDSPRNYYGGNARAKALKRMPPWADKKAIKAIYAEARRLTAETGILHQVDHDIPLNGREVSGLHVESNLQVLTHTENSRKHNHFEVDA